MFAYSAADRSHACSQLNAAFNASPTMEGPELALAPPLSSLATAAKQRVLAAFATADDATATAAQVRAAIAQAPTKARLAGMSTQFGGAALINQELNECTISDLARTELIGLPTLPLLSFWFFRGVVAALLPPMVGGLSILLTFLLLRLVDQSRLSRSLR